MLFFLAQCVFPPLQFGSQQLFGGPTPRLRVIGEFEKLARQGGLGTPALFWFVQKLCFPRFLHQLLRTQKRWQMPGDAIQSRSTMVFGAVFLRFLDLLPLRPDRIHSFGFCISEDVRVATDELFSNVASDLIKIEY